MTTLLERQKDLFLYKKLLNHFDSFIDAQPGTGMSKVYRQLLDAGLKCMPKDKHALKVLDYVVTDNVPKSIQDLLNLTFSDLPIGIRPTYQSANSRLVAFWCKGDRIYSKVKDLLNLEKDEAKGSWCDEKGNKVTIVDEDRKE